LATSSHPGARARITRLRLPALAIAAAAVAATVLPAGIGAAAPASHLTLHQVEAQVSVLNGRAERITEAFDNANTQLAALQSKERVTNRLLTRDRAMLAKAQEQVAAGAAAEYRTGGLDPTMSLVSSGSPQTFIDQTSGLQEVARYDVNQMDAANAAQRQVAAVLVVHNAQVAQQKATLGSITNSKTQIQGLLSQQNALLSQLKATQQRALAAAQARTTQHEVTLRTTYHPPTYNGAASGRASIAIRFAYAQLGKPYQWGGAGPGSFDCSGLTMQSWGAAGVGLPHSAAGQQAELPSVPLSALEPGDLVFYGDPAFHTAIYIGGGQIIQAPHTGTVVQISSLSSMPPTSAGRP
jgi:cell wall-associated NlpC family hydrolase